jgi:hypothetical protein
MAVLRNVFWVVALGVIADVLWLTLAVAALVVLWLYHSYLESRHAGEPDPTMARARERRGF